MIFRSFFTEPYQQIKARLFTPETLTNPLQKPLLNIYLLNKPIYMYIITTIHF